MYVKCPFRFPKKTCHRVLLPLLFCVRNSHAYCLRLTVQGSKSQTVNTEIYLKYISHFSVKTLDEHGMQGRIRLHLVNKLLKRKNCRLLLHFPYKVKIKCHTIVLKNCNHLFRTVLEIRNGSEKNLDQLKEDGPYMGYLPNQDFYSKLHYFLSLRLSSFLVQKNNMGVYVLV